MGRNPKEEKFFQGLQQEVLDFFELNDYRSYSLNQIHKAFAIRDRKTKEIYGDVLNRLASDGRLIRQEDGNFRFDNESFVVEGRVDHVNLRFALCGRGRRKGYLGGDCRLK